MHIYYYWLIAALDHAQKVRSAQLATLTVMAPWNPVAAFWAVALSPKTGTETESKPVTAGQTVASFLFPDVAPTA